MRPQSEDRVTLAAALVDGPGTTRQLAARTGLSVRAAMVALDNMVRAGDATKADLARVPGVKRPVPVYRRALRQADQTAANDAPYHTLISAWMGRTAVATTMESAM